MDLLLDLPNCKRCCFATILQDNNWVFILERDEEPKYIQIQGTETHVHFPKFLTSLNVEKIPFVPAPLERYHHVLIDKDNNRALPDTCQFSAKYAAVTSMQKVTLPQANFYFIFHPDQTIVYATPRAAHLISAVGANKRDASEIRDASEDYDNKRLVKKQIRPEFGPFTPEEQETAALIESIYLMKSSDFGWNWTSGIARVAVHPLLPKMALTTWLDRALLFRPHASQFSWISPVENRLTYNFGLEQPVLPFEVAPILKTQRIGAIDHPFFQLSSGAFHPLKEVFLIPIYFQENLWTIAQLDQNGYDYMNNHRIGFLIEAPENSKTCILIDNDRLVWILQAPDQMTTLIIASLEDISSVEIHQLTPWTAEPFTAQAITIQQDVLFGKSGNQMHVWNFKENQYQVKSTTVGDFGSFNDQSYSMTDDGVLSIFNKSFLSQQIKYPTKGKFVTLYIGLWTLTIVHQLSIVVVDVIHPESWWRTTPKRPIESICLNPICLDPEFKIRSLFPVTSFRERVTETIERSMLTDMIHESCLLWITWEDDGGNFKTGYGYFTNEQVAWEWHYGCQVQVFTKQQELSETGVLIPELAANILLDINRYIVPLNWISITGAIMSINKQTTIQPEVDLAVVLFGASASTLINTDSAIPNAISVYYGVYHYLQNRPRVQQTLIRSSIVATELFNRGVFVSTQRAQSVGNFFHQQAEKIRNYNKTPWQRIQSFKDGKISLELLEQSLVAIKSSLISTGDQIVWTEMLIELKKKIVDVVQQEDEKKIAITYFMQIVQPVLPLLLPNTWDAVLADIWFQAIQYSEDASQKSLFVFQYRNRGAFLNNGERDQRNLVFDTKADQIPVLVNFPNNILEVLNLPSGNTSNLVL
jgi:hypothetical protein